MFIYFIYAFNYQVVLLYFDLLDLSRVANRRIFFPNAVDHRIYDRK